MDIKTISLSRIYTMQRKLEQTKKEVESGLLSQTEGPPQVMHVERGRYLMVDGHHRAVQSKSSKIDCEVVKGVTSYVIASAMSETNNW